MPSEQAGADLAAPAAGFDFEAVFHATPRPLLLIAADPPRYTILAVNAAHAWAFSTPPEALVGHGVLEVFPANGEPMVEAFKEAIRSSLEQVIAAKTSHQMSARAYAVATAEGVQEERYWSAINAPMFGPDGKVTHIVSAVQDVTGEVHERRSEAARRLLMREVDHRARNALSVVQSFVRLMAADTVEAFREKLTGRIQALSRVQTALAARRWEGAYLGDVIRDELGPLTDSQQVHIEGPPIFMSPEVVQAASMAIHELATNATKYGGLSRADGRVSVRWSRIDETWVRLTWTETGGPPVATPDREGFGSRLVTQLARRLGGKMRRDWRPEGLMVEMTLRLPAMAG